MQYKNIGKYVKDKRLTQNLTLNRFAFNCGIEPASLSRFENGKSDILLENFAKIANGFGLTPSELLAEFEKAEKKNLS